MRRRTIKKKKHTTAAWIVTYSDMVTLLLCFFVLLYAFSVLDVGRFQAVLHSLRRTLGVFDEGIPVSGDQHDEFADSQFENDWEQLGIIEDELMEFIDAEQLIEDVWITREYRGLKISFSGRLLFELGKADLTEDAKLVVEIVSDILKEFPNPIRIEGHTDDLPIMTDEFPSNWELSVTRAVRVLRYLIEEKSMDPERFSAIGYGEYWPLVPNTTPKNRALNRRVDIVILRLSLIEIEPGVMEENDS